MHHSANIFWTNPDVSKRTGVKRPAPTLPLPGPKLGKFVNPSAPGTNGAGSAPKQEPQSTSDQSKKEIQLRPVSELPSRFKGIFPYISFNHVQSLVFETMIETNQPVVVTAPTGSGKTGVFELAIVRAIMDSESRKFEMGGMKIVYIAPTKALCSERRDDWEKKFVPFGFQCIELTSDMNVNINFKNLMRSSILLATPEKWDSITRSWNCQKAFVQSIRLFLLDEVHLVNDGPRGATLEAVISRMKTIRSLIWPTDPDRLRFVAVSATVSNVTDIAEWFSTPISKAQVFQVDPKSRPVKLRTIVLGYSANQNTNDFSFDSLLNYKLAPVIKEHSNQKPTLIFCATRKFAVAAASTLAKSGDLDLCYAAEKRKMYLSLSALIRDKALQETTRFGIAFHHAGLCASDRRNIEAGFTDGRVMILSCTSTLAMGVNLPAHLVIIKNTNYFDEGQFKPYSESSLVQMIGRAGRPQFDTSATAVIMTKTNCTDGIERMLSGKLVVDSQLHKYLTQHLNSEIVLGTITNDAIARKWIDSTFFQVRLLKNPENYGLKRNSGPATIEHSINQLCKNSIELLIKSGVAKRTDQDQLEPTEAGRAMARHYICLETMMKLVRLTGSETMSDLISIISATQEVSSDIQLRVEDKSALQTLNNPKDERHKPRFPLGDRIDSREKKAALLIQLTFGNVLINESYINQEAIRVMRNAIRVMNCLKDLSLINEGIGYGLLSNVLTLAQCFSAKLWENSPYVSKQLEKIGPVLSHNLANNGLTTFESLRKANPRNIEVFCNRLSPFGSNVQKTCVGLPVYDLKVGFYGVMNCREKVQLLVEVLMPNGQDLRAQQSLPSRHESVLIVGNLKDNKLLLSHRISDADLLNRPDMTICLGTDINKVDLPDNYGDIECQILSESYVGLNVKKIVKYIEPECDVPIPC